MNIRLILPILIPLATGIGALLVWGRVRQQRAVSLIGLTALLGAALELFRVVWLNGPQAAQMGGWPAPFGITLVSDLLSAVMVLLTAVIGLTVAVFSTVNLDRQRVTHGYYPLINVLLMGICGAFLTGDLFNLYVWFEVLLIASFVLLGLGGESAQLQATVKYVVINLVASVIFLSALGVLYGLVGTLNMADVRGELATIAPRFPAATAVLAALLLTAFGIKAAVFPLFFWLPAAYPAPPVSVSAVFAGLLTKVGVYGLIRTFVVIFELPPAPIVALLPWTAALTMLFGVWGAMVQSDMRRVLAFHSISQIGYMLMGLAVYVTTGSAVALAGSIFFMVHHSVVKSNLFLVTGVIRRLRGVVDIYRLGGLAVERPALAVLFLTSALSLSGLPPLAGFWAKLSLVRAGLDGRQFGLVAVALVVSLLTLYSMTKIWGSAFWQATPAAAQSQEPGRLRMLIHLAPIAVLALLTVVIGLAAESVWQVAMAAAVQLIDPTAYLKAVLP